MNMKQNKKLLILTSLLILLPIAAGALLWNRLPDQFAIHWGPDGQPDGWSGKPFVVFGMPLLLLAIHWLCLLVTASDKHNKNQSPKLLVLCIWICPVISLFCMGVVYASALGYSINMTTLPVILVSLLFFVVGNYMPKCKHNYTIGIKIPWTLASEENWNATHRFAGKLWVAGGILALCSLVLPDKIQFAAILVLLFSLALIPMAYSYLYQRKHG